jgi:ABC-type amino acid transport substrate-binding protein
VKNGFLFLLICVWLAGPAAVASVRAADDITLYLNRLPHRLTQTSGAQYDLFLSEVLRDSPFRISMQAGPLARSKTSFLGDPNSCLFPTNIRALNIGDAAASLVTSSQVDVVSLRLYTAGKSSPDARLADFEPERVGYIRGSGAVIVLGKNADRFMPIESEKQLIRMIELGRIDAFLGHHPDTALAMDQLDKPNALHVSPLNLRNLRFPITFICHDNALGNRFLESVNPRIETMHRNGRLEAILGPHAEFRLTDQPQDPGLLTE